MTKLGAPTISARRRPMRRPDADQQSKPTKTLVRRIYELIRDANNTRKVEHKVALGFLKDCKRILDVGCGTGSLLECDPRRIVGVDNNPDCLKTCQDKGLPVIHGNALDLPFEDNCFEGVHSAHVMHVFQSADALKYMSELVRVTKPRGVIVIATIPDTKRAWIHPENARPYPPLAIRNMFRRPTGATETAPTLRGLPSDVKQEGIWFRRPALIDVLGHSSHTLAAICGLLNGIQYRFLLRKYWAFDGYIIKLRNSAKQE